MSFSTAKDCVDLLFKMYDEDDLSLPINKSTFGLTFGFIGGEPFLCIEIIDYICTYFIEQCIQKQHPWLTHWIGYYSSNGLLYFEEKIQKFLYKWRNFLFPTVSLDGPEFIHDKERIDLNNNGTFSIAYAAFQDLKKTKNNYRCVETTHTKTVITHNKISQLLELFQFYYKEKDNIYFQFNAEENWTLKDASIIYYQLKSIANFMLNNNKNNIRFNLFHPQIGQPLFQQSPLCDLAHKLAFSPNGEIAPCIRFLESSLGCNKFIIGDAQNGICNKIASNLTYDNTTPDKCKNCSYASGCVNCIAYNYKKNNELTTGTSLCNTHKAIVLANFYYWNTMNNYSYKLDMPKEDILSIIPLQEYNYLKTLGELK